MGHKELQYQCAMHLAEMMRVLKDKSEFDEADVIFLVSKWSKVGATLPFSSEREHYGAQFQQRILDSSVIQGATACASLYLSLSKLSHEICQDRVHSRAHFDQAEEGMLSLVSNYRALLIEGGGMFDREFSERVRGLNLKP